MQILVSDGRDSQQRFLEPARHTDHICICAGCSARVGTYRSPLRVRASGKEATHSTSLANRFPNPTWYIPIRVTFGRFGCERCQGLYARNCISRRRWTLYCQIALKRVRSCWSARVYIYRTPGGNARYRSGIVLPSDSQKTSAGRIRVTLRTDSSRIGKIWVKGV